MVLSRTEYLELFNDVRASYRSAVRSADTVLRAVSLISHGEVVGCGQGANPLDVSQRTWSTGPRPYILDQWIVARDGWQCINDRIEIDSHGKHAPTHIDAPSHFSLAENDLVGTHARPLGPIEEGAATIGIVSSRGILIDAPRWRGVDSLEPGDVVSKEEVQQMLAASLIVPEPGDILVFRFGPNSMRYGDSGLLTAGLSFENAQWLVDSRPAMIVTDAGLDVSPSEISGLSNPWHLLVLGAMGVPLVDAADLEALGETCARLDRSEFFMSVAPPPIPGATGLPCSPMAIF